MHALEPLGNLCRLDERKSDTVAIKRHWVDLQMVRELFHERQGCNIPWLQQSCAWKSKLLLKWPPMRHARSAWDQWVGGGVSDAATRHKPTRKCKRQLLRVQLAGLTCSDTPHVNSFSCIFKGEQLGTCSHRLLVHSICPPQTRVGWSLEWWRWRLPACKRAA